MYTVLIVDEEKKVIDSIRSILDEIYHGQLLILTVLSGGDVLSTCQSNSIDILFLSIGMNGLGGIHAIKAIKNVCPSLVIIALSGPDQGKKIKNVTESGAFACISRSASRAGILEIMKDALSSVDIIRRKQVSEKNIREKLDSVINIVESDFIYSLIFSTDKIGDISTYFDFFGIRDSEYYFIIIEIQKLTDFDRAHVYRSLRAVLGPSCIAGPPMRNRVVVFVPFSSRDNGDGDGSDVKNAMISLHEKLSETLLMRVKMGVSAIESDFSRSVHAYNDALKALVSEGSEDSIVYSADCEGHAHETGVYPADFEQKFFESALAGDAQAAHGLFFALSSWLTIHYPGEIDILKNKFFELLAVLRYRTHLVQKLFGDFTVWKDTWKQMAAIDDTTRLEEYTLSGVDECIGAIVEHTRSRMNPIIVKACTVIHEKLSREISLEEIARKVEISPFYFSKLFKEETGENFIDYITMARLRKAKELLLDPSLNVREISAATGYADPNYFSKLFKKVVGVTPTEFRGTV